MALVKCPKCKEIIDSQDAFCRFCGCEIKKTNEDNIKATKSSSSISNASNKTPINKVTNIEKHGYSEEKIVNARLSTIVGMICAVFLGGVGIFIIVRAFDLSTAELTKVFIVVGVFVCILALIFFLRNIIIFFKTITNPTKACREAAELDEELETIGEAIDILSIPH